MGIQQNLYKCNQQQLDELDKIFDELYDYYNDKGYIMYDYIGKIIQWEHKNEVLTEEGSNRSFNGKISMIKGISDHTYDEVSVKIFKKGFYYYRNEDGIEEKFEYPSLENEYYVYITC